MSPDQASAITDRHRAGWGCLEDGAVTCACAGVDNAT
jgi:hypothetical protein